MDHRSLPVLSMLFCVYTLNVYAAFEPVCKGLSPQDQYDTLLQHLYMGYENDNPETSADPAGTVEVIKKNTRCGIQTICLSIMRMTMPVAYFLTYKIKLFGQIARDALVILYNINTVYDSRVFYPLWIFYLYVQVTYKFWEIYNFDRMAKVHEMITAQLKESMHDCTGHNDFEVTDSSVFDEDFSDRVVLHFDQIRPKLKEITGENYQRIDANNLFVGAENFRLANSHFNKIKVLFGKSIEWGDVVYRIWNASETSKRPKHLYNGLEGIKQHQFLYFNLMKIFMLRIISIYLFLVNDQNRLESNAAMYATANYFGNITGLNDDDEAFVKTVNFLQAENPSPNDSKAAIEDITSQLTESCKWYKDCQVPIVDTTNVSQILSEVKFPENDESLTEVQKTLMLAAVFVEEVEKLLGYYDKEFVKSVLALSYKIPENYMICK